MPGCTNNENMKLFTPIDPKKTAKAFCTFVGAVDLKNDFVIDDKFYLNRFNQIKPTWKNSCVPI